MYIRTQKNGYVRFIAEAGPIKAGDALFQLDDTDEKEERDNATSAVTLLEAIRDSIAQTSNSEAFAECISHATVLSKSNVKAYRNNVTHNQALHDVGQADTVAVIQAKALEVAALTDELTVSTRLKHISYNLTDLKEVIERQIDHAKNVLSGTEHSLLRTTIKSPIDGVFRPTVEGDGWFYKNSILGCLSG